MFCRPHRPQDNGGVERGNRTFKEEFYSNPNLLEDSVRGIQDVEAGRAWLIGFLGMFQQLSGNSTDPFPPQVTRQTLLEKEWGL
ncbi:MAG: hypothetical protein HEEMFOPI_01589 [Holosporales bacterium]